MLHALPLLVFVFALLAFSFGSCYLSVAEIIAPPLSAGIATEYFISVGSVLTSQSTIRAWVSGGFESERRPAELKCQVCGNEFVASVPQVGQTVDELPQPFNWTVERIDVRCPSCGSRNVGERDA